MGQKQNVLWSNNRLGLTANWAKETYAEKNFSIQTEAVFTWSFLTLVYKGYKTEIKILANPGC